MKERGIRFAAEQLLAPEQALVVYNARAQLAAPREEHVALDDAGGRICAHSIVADADYPPAARSTMDGFALRSADTPGVLRIAGDVRMGETFGAALERGAALRIATGGFVPAGADAVVPIEDACVSGARLHAGAIASGDCIYNAGEDIRAGRIVVERGRRMGAADVGLLATIGKTVVPVFARPRLAIVSSGDELVPPGASPLSGQVRDSNRYALAAALRELGAVPVHQPIARDDPGDFERIVRAALAPCDGVVLSGGSSVGERDFTPQVIDRLGAPGVVVHGLRVKPGKPTVLGAVEGKPILGLPGNPTSALLILYAVFCSINDAMAGAGFRRRQTAAVLADPIRKREGWTWYVPVALDDDVPPHAHPLPIHSASVSLLTRATGFATLEETLAFVPAHAAIAVATFTNGGFLS